MNEQNQIHQTNLLAVKVIEISPELKKDDLCHFLLEREPIDKESSKISSKSKSLAETDFERAQDVYDSSEYSSIEDTSIPETSKESHVIIPKNTYKNTHTGFESDTTNTADNVEKKNSIYMKNAVKAPITLQVYTSHQRKYQNL